MLDDSKDLGGTSPGSKKLKNLVQATHPDRPEEVNETAVELPEVCPNCGSSDREMEPFIDENGTLTSLLTAICTGCGYRFRELQSLPLSAEAEDAEKSLAILPPKDPRE